MNGTKLFWIVPMVFFSAAAWAQAELKPCGTSETLKKRIVNCNDENGDAASERMTLVMVDDGGHVIRMDSTGLLWGDRYIRGTRYTFTFGETQKICEEITEADGYPEISGVREDWRVPDALEWARIGDDDQSWFRYGISGDGSFAVFPDWHMFFWSSSAIDEKTAWAFCGYGGGSAFEDGWGSGSVVPISYDNGFAVRCVARRDLPKTD